MSNVAPKTYPYRGEQKTVAELAKIAGITPEAMRARLGPKCRMSPEEAVAHAHGTYRRSGRVPRRYQFRGQLLTAKEIARLTGKSVSWVSEHHDGASVAEVREHPMHDHRTHPQWPTYTYAGITDSIAGWSRRTGIPAKTLHRRLLNRWSLKRALTEPAMNAAQRKHPWRAINPAGLEPEQRP